MQGRGGAAGGGAVVPAERGQDTWHMWGCGTCRGGEQGLRWQQLEPLPPADSVSAQPQPQPLRLEAAARGGEVAELCRDARGQPVLCNRKGMLLTSVPPRASRCWALALNQHAPPLPGAAGVTVPATGSCPSPFSHPGPSSLFLVMESWHSSVSLMPFPTQPRSRFWDPSCNPLPRGSTTGPGRIFRPDACVHVRNNVAG